MDIKQLKTFICVAECGSISRASDRLRIAQPALSRQVKLLEHEVSVPLFDRHVRGMNLTEAGKELLARISGPIHQLEQSVFDIKSLNATISGQVVLGILPTIPEAFAGQLLEFAQTELPDITIRLREAYSINLLEWLQSGDLDAAFLYGPPSAYHLNATELLYEDIVLLSPPGSLPDHGEEIDINAVSRLPLALPSRPFGPRLIIDRIAKDAGVQLASAFDVDSFRIIISMVEAGLCHGFMPVSSVTRLKAAKRLETRKITSRHASRHLILAYPSDRPNTRATSAVINLIRRQIGLMIDSGDWPGRACADLFQFLGDGKQSE